MGAAQFFLWSKEVPRSSRTQHTHPIPFPLILPLITSPLKVVMVNSLTLDHQT